MKTSVHFLSYLAHFCLEWEMFQTKFVEKIKTHILFSAIFFFRKPCRLWDNVEKYCRAWQATDDNVAQAHCTLYWITKATNAYSQYVILIAFPLQQWLQERSSMWRLNVHCLSCFTVAQQSLVGQGLLIIEASLLHSDTPHSVGLLWTSDQPDAETCTWQHTTLTRDRHPCSHGIRTRNPRKRAAVDPRLRPRFHRDRHLTQLAEGNDPWKK